MIKLIALLLLAVNASAGQVVKVCALYDKGSKCGTGYYNTEKTVVTDHHIIGPMQSFVSLDHSGEPLFELLEANKVMVLYSDAREFVEAVVISTKPVNDFAILAVKKSGEAVPTSTSFSLGEKVWIVGNPSGRDFEGTVTTITGVYPLKLEDGTVVNMIQIDSQEGRVRAGYSGGPVFNRKGYLLGTVEMCNPENNTCLVIPTKELRRLIKEVK